MGWWLGVGFGLTGCWLLVTSSHDPALEIEQAGVLAGRQGQDVAVETVEAMVGLVGLVNGDNFSKRRCMGCEMIEILSVER
jgi:hypothetical protein